jgi:hypothetical protein
MGAYCGDSTRGWPAPFPEHRTRASRRGEVAAARAHANAAKLIAENRPCSGSRSWRRWQKWRSRRATPSKVVRPETDVSDAIGPRRDELGQIERLARDEGLFLAREFLAPVVRGGKVHVRIAGVVCKLRTRPPDFEGWGRLPSAIALGRRTRAAGTARGAAAIFATAAARSTHSVPARRGAVARDSSAPLGAPRFLWCRRPACWKMTRFGGRRDACTKRLSGRQDAYTTRIGESCFFNA